MSNNKERVIFLDIDGVLNCEVFYNRVGFTGEERYRNMCSERITMLNELCAEVKADVVISSTWRLGKSVDYMRQLLQAAGATFNVIGFTPDLRGEYCVRGNEIYLWLKENAEKLYGVYVSDFRNYVIIDDDSDMLLWQREHFFQTDAYSGLTPNICYRIKRFFNSTQNISK